MNEEDGILLIDKPAGMTSFGVVARVRRVLSEKAGKKVKVGHTGTLDPFATGLLILLNGKGTKRSGEFLKLDKKYEATIRLGAVSTTGDPEGEIKKIEDIGDADLFSSVADTPISSTVLNQHLKERFLGEIEQKVPRYSAVKIKGERAYKLARKGVEVEMPTRKVQIFDLEVVDFEWPNLKIACHVSSGTYIRTLGEDIGEFLGVGGYLTSLRRTAVGKYQVKDAIKLEDFMSKWG